MPRDYTGPMFVLVIAMTAACLPEPHGLEGKACDATHACPEDLVCIASTCLLASTPDVTVLSSDFEAGQAGWESAMGGRLTVVAQSPHGGLQALRLSANDGAQPPFGTQTTQTALAVASGRYCATAFVLHGAAGTGAISLQLRSFGGAGGTALLSETAGAGVKIPPTGKAYQPLRAELEISSAVVSAVRVVVTSGSGAPTDYFLDDVKVVRTVGPCPGAN